MNLDEAITHAEQHLATYGNNEFVSLPTEVIRLLVTEAKRAQNLESILCDDVYVPMTPRRVRRVRGVVTSVEEVDDESE